MYQIGWQLDNLKQPWEYIQQAWLEAHQYAPFRAEPLYWIAQHYHNKNQPHLTFLYAYRCMMIPYPKNVQLWVTKDIYDYKCAELVGKRGYEIEEFEAGAKGMSQTYKAWPKDVSMYRELLKYKKKLSLDVWQTIYPSNKPLLPPPGSNLTVESDLPSINKPATMAKTFISRSRKSRSKPEDISDEVIDQQELSEAENTNQEKEIVEVTVQSSSVAWLSIGINLLIVSVFVIGFLRFSRTKKTN